MASDSSPSNLGCTNYDVFLSFRGEDTRHNFTDHLYTELVRRGIKTFRDDKLRRGEEIEPELLKTIEQSISSIVVLSKAYADSRWCLDELAKIMDCRREFGQIVLPIFYHVDPSDIRKQTGRFGEAFTQYDYEENWKNKGQRWREALTEAASISGWHVNEGYESQHIKEITTIIVNRTWNRKFLFVEDNLVGMDSHFKELSLRLSMESNDVRMVGICGIGGIGKTTIARYVYNQISWGFECSCFLEKVNETYKYKGLLHLQNHLLNDILDETNKEINGIHKGASEIKKILHLRKALIVFDDVDDVDQLEYLIGNQDWYGKGSRIIITTRDKHVLTMLKVQNPYEVEVLNSNEALKLFSLYAFRLNLLEEDFKGLLHRVLHYCQGLPLALKVLGSLLCDKTISEWESQLRKLQKEPEVKIQSVLKISFDGLDDMQKVVFLDIACFFEGEDRDYASKILEGCELCGDINIKALWERCLITISNNRIYMHDLIKKIGWKIVQEQSPEEPSKWSRLWRPNDIYSAFMSKKDMKIVETISLNLSTSKEMWFTEEVFAKMKKKFAKMKKLRLLKVYYNDGYSFVRNEYKISLPKGFEFPPRLRYLHWEGLELESESLPSSFDAENQLVAINLKYSNIKKLWEGKKEKLKFLGVSNSQQLTEIPNISSMPNLERLRLQNCERLRELNLSMGAFPHMKYFKELRLEMIGIEELPSNIASLTCLEILHVSQCQKFHKLPNSIANMRRLRKLRLFYTGIKELPNGIGYLESLESLELSSCSNLENLPEMVNTKCLKNLSLKCTGIKELPSSIGYLESLESLELSSCSNLENLPDMVNTKCLKKLSLQCTGIKELPNSIGYLESLKTIDLSQCSKFEKFPDQIQGNVKCLEVLRLDGTAIKELPDGIGCLEALKELSVDGCSNLEKFPEIQRNMERLNDLSLRGTAIKELPNSIGRLIGLEELNLENCISLKSLRGSISGLKSLRKLSLNGNSYHEGEMVMWEIIEEMEQLQQLELGEMEAITEVPSSIFERLKILRTRN